MKHDKNLVRRRFARHLNSYDSLAQVQRRIADRLGDRIVEFMPENELSRELRCGVEIGAGTGFLTRRLVKDLAGAERWLINDIVAQSERFLPHSDRIEFVACDGETLPFPAGTGLVASASAVQWFDDLPGFVVRAAAGLAHGGMLAVSTFGPENCREITATTGEGLEYHPLGRMAEQLKRSGLEIVHLEEWTEQLWFDEPVEVLRHLRMTGVNAVSRVRWTPSRLKEFEQEYRERYFVPGKGVALTFHPIIWMGRKI